MEETRRQRRKARVRLAVERTIWDEADSPEAERLLDELDDRLDEAALSDAFTDEDVEACIARLRSDLGLAAPPADGEVSSVATPPAGPSPRRSSA